MSRCAKLMSLQGHHRGAHRRIGAERPSKLCACTHRLADSRCGGTRSSRRNRPSTTSRRRGGAVRTGCAAPRVRSAAGKNISDLGSEMLKHRILACLLTLSAIAATPAAVSQTAPDYASIVATPDRSDADRKLDTNRAPAQWLAFIGAKPGMKILDIFAVY